MEQRNEWRRQLTILIISFLAGYLGLDRFYKGQVGTSPLAFYTLLYPNLLAPMG